MTENSRTRECGEQKVLPSNVPVYTRDTSYASGPRVFSICTSDENIELGSSLSTTLNCLRKKKQPKTKVYNREYGIGMSGDDGPCKKNERSDGDIFFFLYFYLMAFLRARITTFVDVVHPHPQSRKTHRHNASKHARNIKLAWTWTAWYGSSSIVR